MVQGPSSLASHWTPPAVLGREWTWEASAVLSGSGGRPAPIQHPPPLTEEDDEPYDEGQASEDQASLADSLVVIVEWVLFPFGAST